MCLQNRNIVPDKQGSDRGKLRSGLPWKRLCRKGLVATAGRVGCSQEPAPKKSSIHCRVCRGFLRSLESFTALPPASPGSSEPCENGKR